MLKGKTLDEEAFPSFQGKVKRLKLTVCLGVFLARFDHEFVAGYLTSKVLGLNCMTQPKAFSSC